MVIQESPVPTGAASTAGCNIRLASRASRTARTTNKATQIQIPLAPLDTAGLPSIRLGGALSVGLGVGILAGIMKEVILMPNSVKLVLLSDAGSSLRSSSEWDSVSYPYLCKVYTALSAHHLGSKPPLLLYMT